MLHRNIIILGISQALSMSGMTMLLLIGGLIGTKLAPSPEWSTLPLVIVIAGAAVASIPAAMLMKKIGRRLGFVLAATCAGVSAFGAAYFVAIGNFYLFCLAMTFFGTMLAFGQQFRFAATECVEPAQASKAVSMVLVGGIFAGLLGPEIGKRTKDLLDFGEYTGSFVVIGFVYLTVAIILGFYQNINIQPKNEQAKGEERSLPSILVTSPFITAFMAASISYAGMAFVMNATPINMHRIDSFSIGDTTTVLQGHFIGMFLPSLFTGHLIHRFGVLKIMTTGTLLMIVCSIFSLIDNTFVHYFGALFLLGVGWNFLFIGGTVFLTKAYRPTESFKVQAVNDFGVFGFQAFASLMAGTMVFATSWKVIHYIVLVVFMVMLLRLLWEFRVTSNPSPSLVSPTSSNS